MLTIMAEVPASEVAAAARALMLAGRWAQARDLLDRTAPADDDERAVLAVAAAEVCVDQDFWCKTDNGSSSLSRASAAAVAGPAAFDVGFIRLKRDYAVELSGVVSAEGGPSWGPSGRDPAVLDDLATRAAALRERAPDAARRAGAAFYAGLIADNLRGEAAGGQAAYSDALRLGEEAGDELIMSYALRHLGYLASQAGDATAGREMLQRSMELRQRAGCLPLVLAQQLALAELAHDGGDTAWAGVVAGQVRTWAAQAFSGTWLVPATESLLASL
jgi:hypothetical protein